MTDMSAKTTFSPPAFFSCAIYIFKDLSPCSCKISHHLGITCYVLVVAFFFIYILLIACIILIYSLLKDNCFTEFCCFLSNLNMNQS